MSEGAGLVFEARDVEYRYFDAAAPALREVCLEVKAGTLYSIIGPNGSGKSTLLKLMLGALKLQSGDVIFDGVSVREWGRRDLARRIGVVPQSEELVFPITVRELVAMGRYPHLGILGRPGPEDERAIYEALERCEIAGMSERPLSTLSGGERQLARIARALAQRPGTLVLDEPTASLDIRHEMLIFELAAQLARNDGVTVIVVTHHVNLAARYAHRLLLLDGGEPVAEGEPHEVFSREIIERVYRWPIVVSTHPGPGPDAGAPQVTPLADNEG